MASQMTKLMQEHIIDKPLQVWILPSFSTTTATDSATSAIVMMGMMKEYLSYTFSLKCGISRVTLEGEKRNCEDILHRLKRLKEYGVQAIAWYHIRPILSHFVSASDDSPSLKNLDFWSRVDGKVIPLVNTPKVRSIFCILACPNLFQPIFAQGIHHIMHWTASPIPQSAVMTFRADIHTSVSSLMTMDNCLTRCSSQG